MGGMNSDLVSAPRLNAKLRQRYRSLARKDFPMRNCALTASFNNAHTLFVRTLGKLRFESALARTYRAMQNGKVGFFHLIMVFKFSSQKKI